MFRSRASPLAQFSFDIGEPYRRARLTVNREGITLQARRRESRVLHLASERISAVGWSRWLLRHGQLWVYTTESPVGFVVILKLSRQKAEQIADTLELRLQHPSPAPPPPDAEPSP